MKAEIPLGVLPEVILHAQPLCLHSSCPVLLITTLFFLLLELSGAECAENKQASSLPSHRVVLSTVVDRKQSVAVAVHKHWWCLTVVDPSPATEMLLFVTDDSLVPGTCSLSAPILWTSELRPDLGNTADLRRKQPETLRTSQYV